MVKTIELPGYENKLFSNEVYTRTVQDYGLALLETVLPVVYLRPEKQDIFDYLMKSSDEIQDIKGKNILGEILAEQPDFRQVLEGHMPHMFGNSGMHLRITYGYIPENELSEDPFEKLFRQYYMAALHNEDLMSQGHGVSAAIDITLQEMMLPPQSHMDILLAHQTRNSGTLNIITFHDTFPAAQITPLLHAVYQGFSKKKQLMELRDISSEFLQMSALSTMRSISDEMDIHNTFFNAIFPHMDEPEKSKDSMSTYEAMRIKKDSQGKPN